MGEKKFEARFITRIEFSLLIYLLTNCFGIRLRRNISIRYTWIVHCLLVCPYTCDMCYGHFSIQLNLFSFVFFLCTKHIAQFVGLWTGFLCPFLFSLNILCISTMPSCYFQTIHDRGPRMYHAQHFLQAIRFVFGIWCFLLSDCQNSWKPFWKSISEKSGKWKMKLHFSFWVVF